MNAKTWTLASALLIGGSVSAGFVAGERKAYADGTCDPSTTCCCWEDTCGYDCGTASNGQTIMCEKPCTICQ
jgi:hypothetical protein